MDILLMFLTSIIFCLVAHEAGHFFAAKLFDETIEFHFSLAKKFIPRFTWTMPAIAPHKQKVIAQGGFGLELLVGILSLAYQSEAAGIYFFVALIHFLAYPWYAGADSDFKWLV